MEQIRLLDSEKLMFSWWLKIRWFIVLILFAIGLLRIGMVHQTVPIVAFVGAFSRYQRTEYTFSSSNNYNQQSGWRCTNNT